MKNYLALFMLNDIIIDFNILQVTNADNELVDIKPEIKLRAIGAGYHNGFGMQFPFSVANFDSFNAEGNESIVRETDCDSAVVVLFNDAFDLMNEPSGGSWVNTVESEAYVEPVTLNFSYTLSDPIPTSDLTYLPPTILLLLRVETEIKKCIYPIIHLHQK